MVETYKYETDGYQTSTAGYMLKLIQTKYVPEAVNVTMLQNKTEIFLDFSRKLTESEKKLIDNLINTPQLYDKDVEFAREVERDISDNRLATVKQVTQDQKGIIVTRTLNNKTYDFNCFTTVNVKVGDKVMINYIDSDRSKPCITHKILNM